MGRARAFPRGTASAAVRPRSVRSPVAARPRRVLKVPVAAGPQRAAPRDVLQYDAQAQVAKDWIWLKNEAKSMLSGINALLLDMVFTTGEIGKELLIFLNDACNLVNGVYTWFESIWCKYFVNYLLNFLISSRGAMSMVASGFEILQDFMDVTFQGVLPAAFIAK